MKGEYLTHRQVETLCDDFMEKLEWVRSDERLLDNGKGSVVILDRIYIKNGELPLGFEVKPENARKEEVIRGIGQMACCLPYHLKPYLILSEKQWFTLIEVFALLPWLGIVVYSKETGKLLIRQKAERKDMENLTQVEKLLPKVKKLKDKQIYDFIQEGKLDGFYTLKELRQLLTEAYPTSRVKESVIGRALSIIGCRRRKKSGQISYNISPNLSSLSLPK